MDRKTWIVIGVAVLALGWVNSSGDDDDGDNGTPAAKASAGASTGASAKPGSGVPTPTAQQRTALLRALKAVDAGLVAKEDRAVSRARKVCNDIKHGKSEKAVRPNTKARFEGSAVPTLTDEQAAAIVAAVKTSFCP
ncbi:DUF732 domain-containing protein [Streptomyces sp. NPDC020412]|uniref:DUF732 domain-containing protein n=1 Tax=Streptomyces sp. NPDC020412 TaxID=3365073 RepID=UPI0037B375A2